MMQQRLVPLGLTLQFGNYEELGELLAKGDNGASALWSAAESNNTSAILGLHKLGANLNEANDVSNETSCYIASQMGNNEALRVLIELGADVNLADSNGTTPLSAAVQEGHVDTARLLCEHSASVRHADMDGFTPVYLAAQLDHGVMVRMLHSFGADIDAPDNEGMTPVFTAAQENRVRVVRTLHELGANVETPCTENGVTPLHIAAETGHADMVSTLLELGASAQTKARDGLSPLFVAAREGHLECVRAICGIRSLLPQALKPIADGMTPAAAAAANGHVEVEAFLLEMSARVGEEGSGAVVTAGVEEQVRKVAEADDGAAVCSRVCISNPSAHVQMTEEVKRRRETGHEGARQEEHEDEIKSAEDEGDTTESPFFPQARQLSAGDVTAVGKPEPHDLKCASAMSTVEAPDGDGGSPAAKRVKR